MQSPTFATQNISRYPNRQNLAERIPPCLERGKRRWCVRVGKRVRNSAQNAAGHRRTSLFTPGWVAVHFQYRARTAGALSAFFGNIADGFEMPLSPFMRGVY